MYNIEELNLQLLSDLKKIAEQLGVKNYKKLAKQELIYAILDTQASTPEKDLPKKQTEDKPQRPKRVNVKDSKGPKKPVKKEIEDFAKSADELLESFDLEVENSTKSSDSKKEAPKDSRKVAPKNSRKEAQKNPRKEAPKEDRKEDEKKTSST